MNLNYDLHIHSNHSDGAYSPIQLIDMAAARGINTIAITDHDTLAGHLETGLQEYAKQAGVKLLPGVEISTSDEELNRWHILGLNIDPKNPDLLNALKRYRDDRINYAVAVIKKLEDAGWEVDQVNTEDQEPVSKATIADGILSKPENQKKLIEVFDKIPQRGAFIEHCMNQGGEAYIPRVNAPTPEEAVKVIKESGGKSILAHPVAALCEQEITFQTIEDLVLRTPDLDGLEAIYYYYAKSRGDRLIDMCSDFLTLAKKLGLIATAGSDFHGQNNIGNYIEIGIPNSQYSMSEDDLRKLEINQ